MYQKLFEPVMVGRLKLKNRLVMPAMCTDFGDKDGYVTQRLLHHYIERAKGGAGLIIIEVTSVAPGGRAQLNQLRIDDDRFISGLSKLAEGIKNGGAKCFIQLHHAGRVAPPAFNDGLQPVAPSAIAGRGGAMPRELTIAEIEGVVESFAQAARRAREAGFDGVELQYAHGYLIAEFLSPLTNKRRDKYGGDLISRARIAVDIIHRIRQVVGSDYPLGVRFTGDEEIKGGLRLNETKRIAVMFEEAGVNVLNVSTGYKASHEEGFFNCANATSGAPMTRPHGCFIPLAEGVKQAVKIPVIAMGRLDDADIALDVIKKGKADLIAIARGHLVDPYFVTKLQENRLDEIRRCIACNRCFETLYREADLRCTVNPELGKDEEYRIKPAKQVKQVLVVGGGPGGMEAARVAALRGHKVILMEKNSELGGNLISAAGVSYKSEISNLTEYLKKAIQKAGVEVK
ncbi:MAG TPA: FAD-dependent oxidoreductase, partial [Dehalococcoidales bacterium]|nr:FAD-dependent oxidoreductase [Dehalococcoidales bacterium]